jgi:hypothetical protein
MVKFRANTPVMAANGASLRAGYNYAETAELFRVQHTVASARLPKGRYRRVSVVVYLTPVVFGYGADATPEERSTFVDLTNLHRIPERRPGPAPQEVLMRHRLAWRSPVLPAQAVTSARLAMPVLSSRL